MKTIAKVIVVLFSIFSAMEVSAQEKKELPENIQQRKFDIYSNLDDYHLIEVDFTEEGNNDYIFFCKVYMSTDAANKIALIELEALNNHNEQSKDMKLVFVANEDGDLIYAKQSIFLMEGILIEYIYDSNKFLSASGVEGNDDAIIMLPRMARENLATFFRIYNIPMVKQYSPGG